MSVYYVSIGNSDDKLSQKEWARFCTLLDSKLIHSMIRVHGRWMSFTNSEFQNDCWCFETEDGVLMDWLRDQFRRLAGYFGQDSIALAKAETEFLTPTEVLPSPQRARD